MPARQLESFNWNLSYTLKLYATAKRTDTVFRGFTSWEGQ